MLNVTGKKDRVRIFDTREQAEAWLHEFVADHSQH